MNELSGEILSFQVYPNPAKEYVIIEYILEKNAVAEFSLLDLNGRKTIYYHAVAGKAGKNRERIPLSPAGKGVYILSLKSGNRMGYHRLIIE